MTIITEDYVSFEVAKLLKEKGMYETCFNHYVPQHNNDGTSEIVTVCTLQMAMKWLREIHRLEVTPFHEVFQGSGWWYLIERNTSLSLITVYEEDAIYGSYEQAAEAGIKYCLENLIK